MLSDAAPRMTARAYIGTSGFSYPHWRRDFYPAGVPQRRWLEFYAERLDTVELNNTFYAMPRAEQCANWAGRAGEDFCFVVKLNRFITHRKRLRDCGELLANYLSAVDEMGDKLGAVLVQLPPTFHADPRRLDDFLALCPTDHRWALEFRSDTWLREDVYDVLRRHNAALAVHDQIADHPREVTADWMYLRFHGPEGGDTGYTHQFLTAEARRIRDDLAADRDVYAYFNNDVGGHAHRNARDLRRYVEGQ